MTPSKKSPRKTAVSTVERAHDHAPTDWSIRKGKEKVPFDIVILTQTPIESEQDILLDHGGEPAAKFGGDARIYRLRDNRFAIMSLSPSALSSPPDHLEFWNWWARTPMPSFSDLTGAKEISDKITQLQFMRESGTTCSKPLS